MAEDAKVQDLLRAADRDGKLIAGWGDALAALARAGVVKGHKVTGDARFEPLVVDAGGKFTGREIVVSKHLVTARDEGAGIRFGQALAEVVRI